MIPNGELCSCYACTEEAWKGMSEEETAAWVKLHGVFPPTKTRMFLCGTCGNKRCPHAADHRNTCTGSNEPGQKGSLYE
jgi:hypothetical protein